ncbi:MAG: IS21 family transposase, partial [Bacteroidota bacterium]
RGSRDFESRQAYEIFLESITSQRNKGREERFLEELVLLKKLPLQRLDECSPVKTTVSPSSSVRVGENIYSIHSRLIGECVQIRVHFDHVEVRYAARLVERLPRLKGRGNHRIDYRHIVDWLLRKPGAFANYRYRADMFPSSYFRIAYDELKKQNPLRADKEYIRILKISSEEGELTTQSAIRKLLGEKELLNVQAIEQTIRSGRNIVSITDVTVNEPDLAAYDGLLAGICQGVLS